VVGGLPAVTPVATARGLDLPGTALAAIGISMLVYPLVQGRELGWPAWSFALLAGSFPVLAAFGWTQLHRKRTGQATLIEPSVFAPVPDHPAMAGEAQRLLAFAVPDATRYAVQI